MIRDIGRLRLGRIITTGVWGSIRDGKTIPGQRGRLRGCLASITSVLPWTKQPFGE